MPLGLASPGSARTPKPQASTPELLQPRREAETQSACRTPVHLSSSAPVGESLSLSHTLLCFLWCFLRSSLIYSSRILWFWFSKHSWHFAKTTLCRFLLSADCPHSQSVPVTGSLSSSLLSQYLFIPRVSFGKSCLWSVFCRLLSHRPSPPKKHCHSSAPTLSLSLLACISCSLCLSFLTYCRSSA